jgi:hypothetical protein
LKCDTIALRAALMSDADDDRPIESRTHRPQERFWPYAELSEEPSDEELAALHPEIRDVLFGARELPFSISIAFPPFGGPNYQRAVELAKASDEYDDVSVGGVRAHRARFFPGSKPLALRDLYEITGDVPGTEVLVDDKPIPYARELWLPLVWLLIP